MRARRGQDKAGNAGADNVVLHSAKSRTLQTPNGPIAAPLVPLAATSCRTLDPVAAPSQPAVPFCGPITAPLAPTACVA